MANGVAETIIEGAGVAGTPNGGVLTVQGIAGATAISVDVSDRESRLVGVVTGHATTSLATGTSAANTAQTVTLPAAGVGFFHYVTGIRIVRIATAALAGTAALTYTSTNLKSWTAVVGNAMAAGGTQIDVDEVYTYPLKATVANTASTIVIPACGAAVISFVLVLYFTLNF